MIPHTIGREHRYAIHNVANRKNGTANTNALQKESRRITIERS